MACFKPNIILIDNREKTENGKGTILQYINAQRKDFPGYEFYDRENETFRKLGHTKEYVKAPCGQCAGCQEAYSREWAIRCINEAKYHKHNYFVTLTYDDEHLPMDDEIVDTRTGEIYDTPFYGKGILQDKDFNKFIKDVRNFYSYNYQHSGIRFFGCGEYGTLSRRPHYHAILFNLPIPIEDLKVYKATKDSVLFESETLNKLWGKGFVTVAEVNWDTCAYVARYVMKKSGPRKKREDYFENGETPEFIRMSRKPGIGFRYYQENWQKIYEIDEIIFNGHKTNVMSMKPPKYYDKIYDMTNHDELTEIKNKRKHIAKINNDLKNKQTSLTEKERLEVEERTKAAKWRTLDRDHSY